MHTKSAGGGDRQGRNFHALAEAGAVLYIAECDELNALKVGVTSRASRTSRVGRHARHGWHTTAEIPFKNGRQAFAAEQAVLAFLRSCGACETLRQDQLPQGGYTETIAFARQAHLSADQLLSLARLAAGILEATVSPLYRFRVAFAEITTAATQLVEEVQALRRAGHRREADELVAKTRPAVEQAIETLQALKNALQDRPAGSTEMK